MVNSSSTPKPPSQSTGQSGSKQSGTDPVPHTDDELELIGPSDAVDPVKAMRLNGDAPRVIRLSRKVIAGLGVVAGLGVGTALIFAFQSKGRNTDEPELYSSANVTKADGLSELPIDYSAVPKLGPPLPGDLGRPIVNAQRKVMKDTPKSDSTELTAEEQLRLQEAEAARLAQLFVPTNTKPAKVSNTTLPSASNPSLPSQSDLSGQAGPSSSSQGTETRDNQQSQLAFLNQASNQQTTSTERITTPSSPYILQAGSIIPAALITGIRSDLPGQITAQVTQNVHDSPTGRILLIPQGTKLIGEYDSSIGFGQSRLLLVWNRLIFPDGRSIILDRQPGADSQGHAGLEDQVDYHWGQMFRAAALSTLLATGAEAGNTDSDSDIVQTLRQGASDSISDIGQRIVERQLDVAPTLTIRPGYPVRVILTRDLILEPHPTAIKGN